MSDIDNRDVEYQLSEMRRAIEMRLNQVEQKDVWNEPLFIVVLAMASLGFAGFIGLVMPHLLRILLGPDHRILVPACILGGGAYMVLCDVMARVLPEQGEIPVGVITAIIGAPFFIYLLKRSES